MRTKKHEKTSDMYVPNDFLVIFPSEISIRQTKDIIVSIYDSTRYEM